ncbi:MAG: DUF1566 domain-containing protein [Candidatus Scalindua sp.]|jgi:hypothetical protein|nr:DUF1566 domain-containing protein [Candidatus Scalindua sp.]MBT5304045.1 DUF1566 domain-containing protein [Candidatus Scalindua sp.]MBT6046240.1 DUF1566 domain-containing protein [Candidatus Scalindua sp.]MBT6230785.1 DUF1566 domain-containing protein [Candidatus Scalindua sp.]MBT6562596.1 DUF1566 domain-containing protein [Candidatus Scalindua sp.]
MERKIEQKLKSDKEVKQRGALTGKGRLLWLLSSIIVPAIIGMGMLVLMYEKPAFGEVDKGKVETSVIPEAKFRSTSKGTLSGESVIAMLEDRGFYDRDWSNSASGFPNDYRLQNDGKVVFDYASGLMWQQSGSSKDISFGEAEKYVEQLNSDQFAGYSDWRLPTLEEAMSLLESTEKSGGLNIDPVFDTTQRWIWTSDINNTSLAWLVNFISGNCYTYVNDYFDFISGGYVRAVR